MPKADWPAGAASTVAKSLLLIGLGLFHVQNFLLTALGLVARAGVCTSITNVALLPIAAMFLLLHPSASRRTRVLATTAFLAVSSAAVTPYAMVRNLEQGCFLCTAHRPGTGRA